MQDHLQTMAYSYQEICQGEEPWIALGNFMNAWYGDAKDQRMDLVSDPLVLPKQLTSSLHKWAAFIAASVEWFSHAYGLPCPAWVNDQMYTLPEPWFYAVGADREDIRQKLIRETPEPFSRRNIYCRKNIYANKYELSETAAKIREIRAKVNQQPFASSSYSVRFDSLGS